MFIINIRYLLIPHPFPRHTQWHSPLECFSSKEMRPTNGGQPCPHRMSTFVGSSVTKVWRCTRRWCRQHSRSVHSTTTSASTAPLTCICTTLILIRSGRLSFFRPTPARSSWAEIDYS